VCRDRLSTVRQSELHRTLRPGREQRAPGSLPLPRSSATASGGLSSSRCLGCTACLPLWFLGALAAPLVYRSGFFVHYWQRKRSGLVPLVHTIWQELGYRSHMSVRCRFLTGICFRKPAARSILIAWRDGRYARVSCGYSEVPASFAPLGGGCSGLLALLVFLFCFLPLTYYFVICRSQFLLSTHPPTACPH